MHEKDFIRNFAVEKRLKKRKPRKLSAHVNHPYYKRRHPQRFNIRMSLPKKEIMICRLDPTIAKKTRSKYILYIWKTI